MLSDFSATAFDYLDDPILVFDQPSRLRERAENRALEFKEHFASALEHDEALPQQADLLLAWDEALARADGRRILALYPFLRTETDICCKMAFLSTFNSCERRLTYTSRSMAFSRPASSSTAAIRY